MVSKSVVLQGNAERNKDTYLLQMSGYRQENKIDRTERSCHFGLRKQDWSVNDRGIIPMALVKAIASTKGKHKTFKRVIMLEGNKPIPEPKIGDTIYIPGAIYVYRGKDDMAGGRAIINKVEKSDHLSPDHYNYLMVGVVENPGTMYNYRVLLEKQEELKKEYGDAIAHPDPDNDPEFNQPDEYDNNRK